MTWLLVLDILIPALLQLLTLLMGAKRAPRNARVRARLGEARLHCRQIADECDRLGIPEQGETDVTKG